MLSLLLGRAARAVEDLSKRGDTHDAVISDIVESIRQLVEPPAQGRTRPIGFTADLEPED